MSYLQVTHTGNGLAIDFSEPKPPAEIQAEVQALAAKLYDQRSQEALIRIPDNSRLIQVGEPA